MHLRPPTLESRSRVLISTPKPCDRAPQPALDWSTGVNHNTIVYQYRSWSQTLVLYRHIELHSVEQSEPSALCTFSHIQCGGAIRAGGGVLPCIARRRPPFLACFASAHPSPSDPPAVTASQRRTSAGNLKPFSKGSATGYDWSTLCN